MWVDRWIRGQAGTHTASFFFFFFFFFFMAEGTVLVHVLCADFSQGGSQERVAWFVSSIGFATNSTEISDTAHKEKSVTPHTHTHKSVTPHTHTNQ